MKRTRNVKVVATLGPASDTHETISALFHAGADVFRLNMSHGSHDEIRIKHQIIRQIEEETGSTIGILADLQGLLGGHVFAGEPVCKSTSESGACDDAAELAKSRGQRTATPRRRAGIASMA